MTRRSLAAVGLVVSILWGSGCGSERNSDPTSGAEQPAAVPGGDSSSGSNSSPGSPAIEEFVLQVVDVIDHDTDAFTQGLVFSSDGRLFESTGEYGDSQVRELDTRSGAVLAAESLPDDVFGEGLALGPDGLVQLTWKEGRAFRWTTDALSPLPAWRYDGEGWGLTYDAAADTFVRSDGTAVLTRHRRSDFAVVDTVTVTRDGDEVTQLNELELIDGALFANVWKSEEILRIDPSTGRVTGVVDARSLRGRGGLADVVLGSEDVLNGIAHRPGDPPNRWYVTGKNWPSMFVVDVEERAGGAG